MNALDDYTLGQSDELLRVTTRDECRELALAITRQARKSLSIFTYDLDPPLLNTPSFLDAARDVLAADPRASIRILLFDVSNVAANGHRLLDLSRRQSSRVLIRKLSKPFHHSFLVADEIGILDRRRAERYEATANFNNQGWASNLLHFFNGVWDRSSPSSELRTLST